ncbi:hypothetical protein NPS53_08075 [Pseudomonas putida]|uniref:hypothetical protein n=1 Tax=Pseudomonas putida TaxID=303 RepID=UPI00236389A4|nr:hypothetical protein [Pseudomonas putida]MDD2139527.1 hypothetical protein [Pseudomonas putida]HDS1721855.1 hypothetical protein [Pseudomonas putida]
MGSSPIFRIEREEDLCSLFIRDFNTMPGWTCYPEAAGFDVLAVNDDGRQLGVEAKLTLNAKVAEQILPMRNGEFFDKPGPDYRLVIVAKITAASAGIAKMLRMLGVEVITPSVRKTPVGDQYHFSFRNILEARGIETSFGSPYLHDWNPAVRCYVPSLLQRLPAGVPSPVQLTPWKEKALQLLALLRRQGFITAKQIAGHGHAVTRWTQSRGGVPAWLAKGSVRGQWIETENMPAFDRQHPELYKIAVEATSRDQDLELKE